MPRYFSSHEAQYPKWNPLFIQLWRAEDELEIGAVAFSCLVLSVAPAVSQ